MKKNYFRTLLFATIISINSNAQQVNCTDPGSVTGDLGCVTFNYRGTSKTLVTVRGADGKVWLQQNLGSTTVATSANDENAYGDLFQWGRWDDGHQLRGSQTSSTVPQPNNPNGLIDGISSFLTGSAEWWKTGTITDKWEAPTVAEVLSQNGCDPCKALGNGWSLPSQAEWANVISSEQINNLQKAYESNLKLTLGGSRTSSGSFNFVGQRGYYWSNTTTATTGYAKHLYYSSAIINANSGSYRELGMSVRCLKSASLGTVEFNSQNYKFYPNPTSGTAKIQSDSEIEHITIYNQFGQLILNQKEPQIDLSTVASGIYFVHINFIDGRKGVQKVIKK